MLRFSLDTCEHMYTSLGHKVFNQAAQPSKEETSWRESLYRMYKSSSQSMRVSIRGNADAGPAVSPAVAPTMSVLMTVHKACRQCRGKGVVARMCAPCKQLWLALLKLCTRASCTSWWLQDTLNHPIPPLQVAVYGCKHDASTFEELLKETCQLSKLGAVSERFIDGACFAGPKVRSYAAATPPPKRWPCSACTVACCAQVDAATKCQMPLQRLRLHAC